MNYTTIEKFSDFKEILDADILITGDPTKQREELEYNTWYLSFSVSFIKELTLSDIQAFIDDLIKNRKQQAIDINKGPVTFYIWYDEQSLNLGFDILSGTNINLPFGCKLNVLNDFNSILNKVLADGDPENNPLNYKNFTFLEQEDPGWDEFDSDDDEVTWIQDVFVRTLP